MTIQTLLPGWGIHNIRLFYLLTVCTRSYLLSAVWLYFFRLFVDYGTLGLIDGLGFVLAWLVDIPTGALADRFGRKILISIGCLAGVLGALIMGLADGGMAIFWGNFIYLAAYSFFSGAIEALVFESLRHEADQEKSYARVIAANQSLGIALHIATPIAGAWLYSIAPRLPFLVLGSLMLVGLWLSTRLQETLSKPAPGEVGPRFLRLLKDSRIALREPLLPYVIYSVGVCGIFTAFTWGYLRPALAVRYGFSPTQLSYILSVSYATTLVLLPAAMRLRSVIDDQRGLALLGALSGISFITAALNLGMWGALLFPVIGLLGSLVPVWLSIIVNQKVEDRYRATILSTVGFAEKILYCFVAWAGGFILQSGMGGLLFAALGALCLIATAVSIRMVKV